MDLFLLILLAIAMFGYAFALAKLQVHNMLIPPKSKAEMEAIRQEEAYIKDEMDAIYELTHKHKPTVMYP